MAVSEDNNENSVTSAAKAQALTGTRVFTGTPSSMVMRILPRVARPYTANTEGGAPVPPSKPSRESNERDHYHGQQELLPDVELNAFADHLGAPEYLLSLGLQ